MGFGGLGCAGLWAWSLGVRLASLGAIGAGLGFGLGAKPHQKTLYLIPVIAGEDPEMEFGRLASRQCASRRSPRSLLAAMLRALLPRRFRT